jgi:ABC-type lipoprotein release transport system permease subunit
MKDDIKIAWRNLWRNRRRTIITAASVFFAVFFAVIMRSYQLGTYDMVINNFIKSFSGHLKIQNEKYKENPLIDYSFKYNDELEEAISGIKNVTSVVPHLESFALVSNGPQSKGVAIIAIDPGKERDFSNPENNLVRYRITTEAVGRMKEKNILPSNILAELEKNYGRAYSSRGRLELELGLPAADNQLYMPAILDNTEVTNTFLADSDEGVLVSDRLAGFLKVSIGDTVILMGQGYQGVSAAGIFPVRGIIKMPSPDIDNKLIIMTIPTAQEFFGCEGMITSLAVNLTGRSNRTMRTAQAEINTFLSGSSTVARTWYELNPVLYQQIQGDSQSGMAMLGLLYFIIFFGIFGTVLMMIAERKREFGVLVAIGMQKGRLKRILSMEMIFLGIMGLVAGLLASMPLILYFNRYPIVLKGDLAKMMEDYGWDAVMPTAPVGSYFYMQAAVVATMVIIATIYPLMKIGRLKEIEALRS